MTPKLQFIYDRSVQRGQRLSDLIDDALAADREAGGQLTARNSENEI